MSQRSPWGVVALLTAMNLFNYLDRQVVYTMTPFIADTFNLPKYKLGWLTAVNLVVFALASLVSSAPDTPLAGVPTAAHPTVQRPAATTPPPPPPPSAPAPAAGRARRRWLHGFGSRGD